MQTSNKKYLALIAGDYLQLIAVAGAIQEGFERHKKKQIQQRGEKTTQEQRQQILVSNLHSNFICNLCLLLLCPWALNRTDFFFNIYLGTAIISCDRWMLLLLLYWKNIKLMFVVMNNYNCYCVGIAVVT